MAGVSIEQHAQVIVLGNEKGGSGKSTAAMHVIVGLLRDGYRVGAIDLDARQATLTGYLAAREAFSAAKGIALPVPEYAAVHRSERDSRAVITMDGTPVGYAVQCEPSAEEERHQSVASPPGSMRARLAAASMLAATSRLPYIHGARIQMVAPSATRQSR